VLSSDDITSGITRVLVFIPVTLLGNDPDPIVHWYFKSSPVAEHVNVAVCVRSTLCGDGGVINVGAATTRNININVIHIRTHHRVSLWPRKMICWYAHYDPVKLIAF